MRTHRPHETHRTAAWRVNAMPAGAVVVVRPVGVCGSPAFVDSITRQSGLKARPSGPESEETRDLS